MTCPDRETLSAFFDGEAQEVRVHIDGCAACQAVLREYEEVHQFLGSSRSSEFLGEPRHAEKPRNARNRWAVAVALLVLVVVVAIAFRHPPSHPGTFADYDGGGRAVIYVKGRS